VGAAVIVAGLVAGCASGKNPVVAPAPDLLARAEALLTKGKNRDAEGAYRTFLDHYPSDPKAQVAQLGLAKSILGQGEWERARGELSGLIERYPDSSEIEEARYLTGVTYSRESLPVELDQELTRKALEEFEAYLADFPAGGHRAEGAAERGALREKLADKELRNGQLYLRMGFPDAARTFFQQILDRYGDTTRAERASFGLAEVLRAEGKNAEAGAIYRRLLESETDPRLKKECERRLREMETRVGTAPQG
jgi:outer membrane assembly lipoprotein YfiO